MQEIPGADAVQQVEGGFGERVREARQRRKLTQRQLADQLQLDGSAISRLEQGTRAIRLGEAALIARALQTDLNALVFGTNLDPAIQLDHLRDKASIRTTEMRAAAELMASGFLQIIELLDEHPDLLGNRSADSISAVAVDEYLLATLAQINRRFDVTRNRDRIVLSDKNLAARIMALIYAAVQDVVSDVPLPPSQLGRGLASLIPTTPHIPNEEEQDASDT